MLPIHRGFVTQGPFPPHTSSASVAAEINEVSSWFCRDSMLFLGEDEGEKVTTWRDEIMEDLAILRSIEKQESAAGSKVPRGKVSILRQDICTYFNHGEFSSDGMIVYKRLILSDIHIYNYTYIIMPAYIEYGIGTGSYHKASSAIEKKNIYIEYPGPGHRI